MKILKIVPALNHGGIERGTVDFAIDATQRGHDVTVTSSGGKLLSELSAHHIPHINGPWEHKNPLDWYARAKTLGHLIHQNHFDIIHAHSRLPCWLAHLSRRYHDVPLITSCHGAHGMGPWGLKKIYNASVTKGDLIIAASETIGEYLTHHFPHVSHRVRVVQRGSRGPSANDQDPQRLAALKQQWELDDRPVILFPARITPGKGQHIFLESLNHLPKHHSLQILFVGKCDNLDYDLRIKKQAEPWRLQHHVAFLGNCDTLNLAYHLADVVINSSSRIEAFGRIPVEAGLCHRCTIAPYQGGFRETIVDGKTGWHFEHDNPKDLARVLDHFLTLSPNKREAMQNACHTHMAQHFSLAQMTDRVLNVYKACLKLRDMAQ